MTWFKQLRLLLVKNYLSHRRQKLRVIMEIIWPLLLMLVLMWARTRGLRTFEHECHFDQKSMPSAGFIEFVKSTICSFNNTCNPQITDGVSQLTSDQSFNQSTTFPDDPITLWPKVRDAIDESGNDTIRLLQLLLCGRNSSEIYGIPTDESGMRLDEVGDELKQQIASNHQSTFGDYIYDNTTTPECNKLFASLETGSVTRVVWGQLKPFVRGKIVYSPRRTSIERVLSRVMNFFQPITLVHDLAVFWINDISPNLTRNYNDETSLLDQVTNLISSNNMSFVTDQLGLNSPDDQDNVAFIMDQFRSNGNSMSPDIPSILRTIDTLMREVKMYTECFEMDKLEAYETEDEVVRRGLELMAVNKLFAGLVFENLDSNNTNENELPTYVRYKIRMDSSKVDGTRRIQDSISTPGSRRRPLIDLKYITFGFAYLQDLIEKSIIREQTNVTSDTGIYLQQFPYPCYIDDQFILAISRTFPMFMVLSWVYNASMIIKSIVHEKELRLKEVMKVMGLSNSVLWSSWFIESLFAFTISSFLLTLILHFGKVLTYSDPFIIFIFLLLYSCSVITQCFTISTIFSKANMAAAGGGMIFFLTYLPYGFLILWEELLFAYEKALGCLLPNVAFGFGCSYLAHYEEEGIGVQWSNIASSPITDDDFSMLYIFGMLIADSILNVLVTVYIEAVFPGQFGVPKPFYFFLMPSYWWENRKKLHQDEISIDSSERNPNIEEEPKDLKLGISISKLSKVYSGGKLAVDDLSLNFYEGQITSFLGHNGAGKTTTISILTGLFPPTSGTAWIYGHDITTEMDTIRRSLGTCPQYNVLFNNLTVEEHLRFYASLKGAGPEVESEIDVLINDLGLSHKRNEFPTKLSGGMQRKLSIAIAFVGGSRTVILDEPTAGVDPFSRRSIWELLIKYKAGRTIILTTHHMDEADLLGDRIAVIGNGKLRCVGSSLFLKSRFGSGYYLTFVTDGDSEAKPRSKSPTNDSTNIISSSNKNDYVLTHRSNHKSSNETLGQSQKEYNSQVTELTTFIQNHVPDAQMIEKVGSELTYLLPTNSQESGALQNLLRELDSTLEELKVKSYGISDTPLEEVFLRVTGTLEEENKLSNSLEEAVEKLTEGGRYPSGLRLNSSICNNLTRLLQQANCLKTSDGNGVGKRSKEDWTSSNTLDRNEISVPMKDLSDSEQNLLASHRVHGYDLQKRQFWALQRKRFHHTRRNYRAMLCEIVVPTSVICVAMLFTMLVPPITEEPQLELKPWLYGPPNGFFYNDDSLGRQSEAEKYMNELTDNPGIGTRCVQGIPEKYRNLQPELYKISSAKRFRTVVSSVTSSCGSDDI